MNWLRYLIEANLYLGIFYLCYVLFLRKQTHYMLNRIYLLFTCTISFIIPVVQLGILKPAEPAVQTVVLLAPANIHYNNLAVQTASAETHFSMQEGIFYAYILGAT